MTNNNPLERAWDDLAAPDSGESYADRSFFAAPLDDEPEPSSNGFFDGLFAPLDDGGDTETRPSGLGPVGFERERPSGRMAPENVGPDPTVPADRDPGTGRFVSRDRTDPGIGRDRESGLFERL